MAYLVHITDADRAYLAGLPLSETAKERIEDFIDYGIAQGLLRDFLLLDKWGDGQLHRILFVISDEHAAAGVLVIVYVEHQ